MKLIWVIIIVFLAAVYLNTFMRYRKRRKKKIDTVGDFRKKYLKRNSTEKNQKSDEIRQFYAKYNSSLDYIAKDDFIREASEAGQNQRKL